jgi:hypothetical protein
MSLPCPLPVWAPLCPQMTKRANVTTDVWVRITVAVLRCTSIKRMHRGTTRRINQDQNDKWRSLIVRRLDLDERQLAIVCRFTIVHPTSPDPNRSRITLLFVSRTSYAATDVRNKNENEFTRRMRFESFVRSIKICISFSMRSGGKRNWNTLVRTGGPLQQIILNFQSGTEDHGPCRVL